MFVSELWVEDVQRGGAGEAAAGRPRHVCPADEPPPAALVQPTDGGRRPPEALSRNLLPSLRLRFPVSTPARRSLLARERSSMIGWKSKLRLVIKNVFNFVVNYLINLFELLHILYYKPIYATRGRC